VDGRQVAKVKRAQLLLRPTCIESDKNPSKRRKRQPTCQWAACRLCGQGLTVEPRTHVQKTMFHHRRMKNLIIPALSILIDCLSAAFPETWNFYDRKKMILYGLTAVSQFQE
jgi:hypothetical protein